MPRRIHRPLSADLAHGLDAPRAAHSGHHRQMERYPPASIAAGDDAAGIKNGPLNQRAVSVRAGSPADAAALATAKQTATGLAAALALFLGVAFLLRHVSASF